MDEMSVLVYLALEEAMPLVREAPEPTPSKTRDRSPNFPAISLPEALKKITVIYKADGKAATGVKVILGHLGYGQNLSGSSGRVVSALRQYGLIEDVGDEKYRVSPVAVNIIELSDESPVRRAAITASAKKPPIFRDVLNAYADRLPSDSAFRDYLITDKKFNPASVDAFIRSFKGTADFAKLYDGSYNGATDSGDRRVAVGDHVQWESLGVDQFAVPPKVTSVSPDGAFVFVEGTATGIPMEQVQRVDPPLSTPAGQNAALALKPPVGVAREVSSLQEGEAVLQWPATMSPESVLELQDWLELVVRKMKRRYGVEAKN